VDPIELLEYVDGVAEVVDRVLGQIPRISVLAGLCFDNVAEATNSDDIVNEPFGFFVSFGCFYRRRLRELLTLYWVVGIQ